MEVPIFGAHKGGVRRHAVSMGPDHLNMTDVKNAQEHKVFLTGAGGGGVTGGGAATGGGAEAGFSFSSSTFLGGGSGGWGTTLTTQLIILKEHRTCSCFFTSEQA